MTTTYLRPGLPALAARPRGPLVIAHRGFSHVAPENTLHAVHRAAAAGADAVEVDVQRSRDGHLVVLHDRTLRRTTDVARLWPTRVGDPVESFTLAELRRLDAGSWKHPNFAGVGVPTLRQVLALLQRSGTDLLLDLKEPASHPGIATDLARLLDDHPHGGAEHVFVQSFDAGTLHDFARQRPSYRIGLLTLRAPALPAPAAWATAVNPWHHSITDSYVRRAQLAGLRTYAWTVNTEAEMRRLTLRGVDALITDRPDLARETISRELALV